MLLKTGPQDTAVFLLTFSISSTTEAGLYLTAYSLAATQPTLLRVPPLRGVPVSCQPLEHCPSPSPTERSGQRAARFYSWILKEILKPSISICSDPSVKPRPLRIYVAFLPRHKSKDDSPGIPHHSLRSWSNGFLGQ